MRQVILVVACALAGCQTTANDPSGAEAPIFGRADCRRIAQEPALARDFEVAKTVCTNRAEAAAVAGTTAIPVGRGMADAISSGMERGMAQRQIGRSTVIGCMAEYGYLLKTNAQHEAMCAGTAGSLKPPTQQTKPVKP